MSKETFAAIVATFNRRDLLDRCIDAVLSQTYLLDAIYIIDNASSDGTYEHLVKKGLVYGGMDQRGGHVESTALVPSPYGGDRAVRIHYVRMVENMGGAGAFHEGTRRAYEAGYDWLWLMDDDGSPDVDALGKLLAAQRETGAYVLNCAVVAADGESLAFGYTMYEVEDRTGATRTITKLSDMSAVSNGLANFFNGTLINRRVIETVGYPKGEFFIWGDEMDFCFRIQDAGFKTYTVPSGVLRHPSQRNWKTFTIFGKSAKVVVLPPWNLYYAVRNSLYLERTYKLQRHPYIKFFGRCVKYLLISLLVGEKKARSLYCLLLACVDGLLGRIYVNRQVLRG